MLTDEIAKVRELFAAQYAPLRRYLLARLSRHEDAEDLAQEAFLRLLRVPHAELIRQPDAYLYRIAANLILEFRMRARRSRVLFDSDEAEIAGAQAEAVEIAGAGISSVEQGVDLERIQRAVDDLPPKMRAVLALHRRSGLTYAQIGSKLGISSNMVKKYLASAVRRCRSSLGETNEGA